MSEQAPNSAMIPGDIPPKRYQYSLKTIQSVRLALADCLRDLRAGRLDPKISNALVFGYKILADLLKEHALEDMQRRLEALEREPKAIPINAPREKTG